MKKLLIGLFLISPAFASEVDKSNTTLAEFKTLPESDTRKVLKILADEGVENFAEHFDGAIPLTYPISVNMSAAAKAHNMFSFATGNAPILDGSSLERLQVDYMFASIIAKVCGGKTLKEVSSMDAEERKKFFSQKVFEGVNVLKKVLEQFEPEKHLDFSKISSDVALRKIAQDGKELDLGEFKRAYFESAKKMLLLHQEAGLINTKMRQIDDATLQEKNFVDPMIHELFALDKPVSDPDFLAQRISFLRKEMNFYSDRIIPEEYRETFDSLKNVNLPSVACSIM